MFENNKCIYIGKQVAYLKRKEFNVEKIIRIGVYEPLYIKEGGKIKKWDSVV